MSRQRVYQEQEILNDVYDPSTSTLKTSGSGSSSSSSALTAGEAHVGQVVGNTVIITLTPTLTVHATYIAGDYVGTSAVAMIFDNIAIIANGSGIIQSAELIDSAANTVPAELWLFDSAITPPNDSAAWTLSDADAKKLIGVIPFSTYYVSGANSVAPISNLGIAFQTIGNDDKLYGCLVTRGAPTYADGDLTVRLGVLQD